MTSGVLNLPNCITIARIAIIPLLVLVMLFLNDTTVGRALMINKTLSFFSTLLVAVAMLSDIVDGYLARRFGAISTFGKFLDPLADKLLFLTAMVMMIPPGRIPAWIVVLFFTREMTVTALRAIAVEKGVVIAASRWGKYKSAFISSATIGLLLHYPFFGIEWRLCAWLMMVPALVFSVVSGVHYTVGFFGEMRRIEASI